ncbi:TetR/AcrR family transcriptional regulator [Pseudomonas chlororaphis]|uniref:TetR/AcrR family transcriptional regulator n=1 Tax=Pseudomonas chlororaphis TaxID=587753 RepID=UPI001B30913D|nr:TetR/AcrR family transcriptional regulator [Pseudomonas chlororaphis]MBP5059561.1 TetR/AcrR family transcriptional regulator [Pseudomonas chlororaphis]MBP5143439.1 TetR/AcrR family transcriptional regulator [Pseudomonas chlororaphis]QTT98269.1 TetR/AcrR family transcriptional regulator [Pseudomonas chlororaphis]
MAQMGRPRTFDRDEAVQQAMHLFWQHGYEATSLSLLKAGIGGGITAPSFYAAFGSKEALFREVVERYLATHGQVNASLWDNSLPPRQAVELALRRSARMQTERSHPKGCLLVLSASTCSPEHEAVQKLLASRRARARGGFQRCVQRAVDAGELPTDTDVRAFAASFHSFLLGLSVQARDGVPGTVLDAAVTEILRSWDARAPSAHA